MSVVDRSHTERCLKLTNILASSWRAVLMIMKLLLTLPRRQATPSGRELDWVLCSEVLEHVAEPISLLEEVNAILKKWKILLTCPFVGRARGPE